MNTQSGVIICPKCGTENTGDAQNCVACRINLSWALDHYEEYQSELDIDFYKPIQELEGVEYSYEYMRVHVNDNAVIAINGVDQGKFEISRVILHGFLFIIGLFSGGGDLPISHYYYKENIGDYLTKMRAEGWYLDRIEQEKALGFASNEALYILKRAIEQA